MAPLKGSNLSSLDASLIAAWVAIPNAVRVLVSMAAIASFGWGAHAFLSDATAMSGRVTMVEDTVRVMRRDQEAIRREQEADRRRVEHGMMYMMCLIANPGEMACDFIVREYPEFRTAVNDPARVAH